MGPITVFPARKVITMDPGRPLAEAIAVMDGKVLSTGTLTSMRPWLSRHSHVIDDSLKTKVILPGFIDPHTHFAMSSGFVAMLYVGPIASPGPGGMNPALLTHEAVLARLREADRLEEDRTKPVVAWGLDPALQGGHLHRDELDTITHERPIWVIAYAPHFVYLNSPALARSGVRDSTAVHGVHRYEDGRLSGVFAESEATELAATGMPVEISLEGGVRGLRHMADVARRAGITTTAEMGSGTRGSRSTVMPTATRRSMLRSMRWRNCSGCARASTIVSRLSIVASASPPERQRALNMLWNLMPIGWRTQGILNDVRFASAPQSIAVDKKLGGAQGPLPT